MAQLIYYRSKENYSNYNGQNSLWVSVKNLLGVTSISEVWDQFGGSIILKKAEKKTTRRRPASNSENKRTEKRLNTSLNQAFLRVCTKNYDRVIRIREDMAVIWPPTSYWDFFGFRHFEDVAKKHWFNLLIILIIRVTKANMDSLTEKESYSGPNSA